MYVRWTQKNDGQILYIACHVILELTLSPIKKKLLKYCPVLNSLSATS